MEVLGAAFECSSSLRAGDIPDSHLAWYQSSTELVMWGIFFIHLKHSILCKIVIPCREITGYRGFLLSAASLQPGIH